MKVLLAIHCAQEAQTLLEEAVKQSGAAVHTVSLSDAFAEQQLAAFDLVILYSDCFHHSLKLHNGEALSRYVLSGGGLLCMHGAITAGSVKGQSFLAHLMGAGIQWLPSTGKHEYFTLVDGHVVVDKPSEFTMDDVDLRLTIDRFARSDVFLRMKHLNTSMPAGWARPYGKGRVVYLGPGRMPAASKQPEWQTLFESACKWAQERT